MDCHYIFLPASVFLYCSRQPVINKFVSECRSQHSKNVPSTSLPLLRLVRRQTQEAMCVCFNRVIHKAADRQMHSSWSRQCVPSNGWAALGVPLVQAPHSLCLSPLIEAQQRTLSTHTTITSPMEGTLTKKVVATYSLILLIFPSVL